jgi:uncharacterized repeat protein (TIGR01451 family)
LKTSCLLHFRDKADSLRLFVLCAVVALFSTSTMYAQSHAAPTSDQNGPHIWLGERQSAPVKHVVANSTVNAVVADALGQPVSMTGADVDEDGVNDLVVGYAGGQGTGSVVIHRGNLDAFAPQSEASFQAIGRGEFPSPFLAEARTIPVPLNPDFIAIGNFTGNGHSDLVVAAKGGTALYVLSGDGKGNFSDPQMVTLPGGVTTLAAGSFGNSREFGTLLVGTLSPQNVSSLTIFRGTPKGLSSRASFPLSAPATSIAFGDLDGDAVSDAAILAGGQVSVLHSSSLIMESVQVPVSASAMALGSFLPDRVAGRQIALLASDGSVQIVGHNEFDPRSHTVEEMTVARQTTLRGRTNPLMPVQAASASGWKVVESIPSAAPFSAGQVPVFFSTRISSNAGDDVMALNAFTGQMSLISHADPAPGDATFHAAQVVTRPYTGSPLFALPMRINIDGRPGIVVLHQGEELPSFMMPLPDPTFFVNRNDDPVPGTTATTCNNVSNADTSSSCSLREAVIKANSTAGTDTILLAAGTYTLAQPRVANNFSASHGTLDVTDSVNIVGAGQNSTIIQGGTNATTSVDKVFSFNPDIAAFTNATVSVSNLTIQFGHNRGNTGIQDGWGGAFDFDTGGTSAGTGNATLSLSNVTLQNNSLTDGEGGGFAIFNTNSGSGNATVSNSIIQNNSATRSTTNAAGNGGGIFVAFPAALTMSNSQVINNTATQVNGSGVGVGGGIFIIGGGTHTQTNIHGGSISGNAAAGDGGGIWSDAGTTIDQQAVISGNTAGSTGGGIWYNGSAANTASFSKITVTGNSASVKGGGILSGNPSLGPTMSMSFSRLAGNSAPSGSNLENAGSVATVTDNWWGTNSATNTIHTAAGTTTFDPFITLTNTASPTVLSIGPPNPSATVTASFIQDNHGTAIAVGNLNVLIGLPAPASIFPGALSLGTVSNVQTSIQANGQASETFTATAAGVETINAVVDQATVPANITILAPPTISKAFGAATIPINGTTTLTFTVNNPSPNTVAIHGVAFSDTFPSGLSVAATPGVVNNCGGTFTAAAGATTVSLSGATVNPGSCTIAVNITGSPDGVRNNLSGAVSSTDAGTQNSTASATITVINPPAITKAFGAASIPLNGTTSLTFNISNSNTVTSFSGLAFTDSLPAGLVVATPNGLSNTCGGTASATAGSSSVSLSGGTVAANASCTVSVNVQGVTAGVKNNSVSASSTNGGLSNTSNASITVISPPTISKAFGAASIPLNGSTSLSFTIQNPNTAISLTGVGFTDTLPAGLVVSTPNGLTGACGGGTITATAGTNAISLSGGSLAASSSCTFSVNVTGIAAGLQNNTTGNITSTEGGTGGTASASVIVEAPPSIAKVFNPSTIALNGTTSLTFTITNPANPDPLTGVAFTDTLPAGLTVADSSATVCGGTLTTAAPTGIALTGATIAANSQCQFSVTVTGAASGQYTNTTGNVTSTNGGTGNIATANLSVASASSITKAFGAASIPLNGTTSLTFTIQNPNTALTLNGIAFADSLPAGLVVATPNGLTNTCSGTATATAGSSSVSLTAGTLAANASCTVSVNVQGTTAGVKNNSVSVSSTEGGTGNTSNASISVVSPPTISKAFGAASIGLNGSTSLSFTIQNPNTATSLTGVGFTDTLPAGLVVSTPNALTGACGTGSITATAGSGSVSLTGATLAASASCTFSVNVTATTGGDKNNTTGPVTSTEGGTGGTASATVSVVNAPSITKAFGAASIPLNGTTALTFTIVNSNTSTTFNGLAFTDSLPAGLVVAPTPNLSNTCGGTAAASAGSSSISLSAGTLGPGASCTVSANVQGVTAGVKNNSVTASTTDGATSNTSNASITVVAPPTISKAFGAATVQVGGSTSLSFTIQNPNTTTSLTGVGFTDTLPSGLVVSTPNGLTGSCGGGTITATAGSGSVSLAGATLAASASCTFSVNVTAMAVGTQNNTTGPVTSTEGGTGGTASASVSVQAPVTVQVTVGTTPAGLSFSVDGTTFTTQQTFTWVIGSSHTLATTSPQAGTPGQQFVFNNWSDAGAISHTVIAPPTATAYTASFNTQYQLTTGVSPAGSGTVTPASGQFFNAGTVVPISATANSGFTFSNWTGAVANPSSASTTVTMNAAESVVANFTGTGVIVSPTSIDFGTVIDPALEVRKVHITNPGTSAAPLHITLTPGSGPQARNFFFLSQCPASLLPGKSCDVFVTFAIPGDNELIGVSTATLNVTSGSSVKHVALRVTAIDPEPLFRPGHLDFGTHKVLSTATQSVTLSNIGKTPLLINGVSITGVNATDFSQTNNCPASLSPGSSCRFEVTFKPKARGNRYAKLSVANNDKPGTDTVPLNGTGN